MQFCVRGTGAQPKHGKSLVDPVWGEHKMIIFKIMEGSPNFRSYLWKMVVVSRHCRILHRQMEVTWGRAEGKTLFSTA